MEIGASYAYRKIDNDVDRTLEQVAAYLKEMKEKEMGSKKSIISAAQHFSSMSSMATRQTITLGSTQKTLDPEPKATIRTPRDSQKKSFFFPDAKIGCKGETTTETMSPAGSTDVSVATAPTPVEMFPEAIYIPAHKNKRNIKVTTTKSESAESTKSIHRLNVLKFAVEPLEDMKDLKGRGLKKPKPDEMFPAATYHSGEKAHVAISPVHSSIYSSEPPAIQTSAVSCLGSSSHSYLFQPMEFHSTDGRVKMLLQPIDEKKKKEKKDETEEFPIVPKQLQSSTKLKILEKKKTKFSAKFALGDHSIDISGMFNGKSMKKDNLSKLVINGKSYST